MCSNVARARKRLGALVKVTPGTATTASTYRLNIEISDPDLAALSSDSSATSDRRAASVRGSDPSATYKRKQKKRDIVDSSPPVIERVIRRLNELTGRTYRHEAESTARRIRARLDEGFTEADLTLVVEDRCARWLDDPKMRDYLRPATLFNSEKFESYLQAARHGNGAVPKHDENWRRETFINA